MEWVCSVNERPHVISCSECPIPLKATQIINFQGRHSLDIGRHYSPALGKYVRNERELRAEAKDRGLIPLENNSVESIRKHFHGKKEEEKQKRQKVLVQTLREKLYRE